MITTETRADRFVRELAERKLPDPVAGVVPAPAACLAGKDVPDA